MKRQSLNPRGFYGGVKGMLTACLAILTLGFALPAGAQNNYAVTSVVIKAPSGSSVFESCPPANGQIDPDESVTVVVTFKNNNASAGPSDLTATLATTGGVNGTGLAAGFTVDLSEAIGALAAGASISKEFTFRASATNEAVNARFCGENLNMTFNLTGTGVAAAPTINVRLGVINNVVTTFSNTGAIQINDSPAAATASSVVVSGLTSSNHLNDARISKVRVHLYGFTHSYTKDVDVVLVGPGGVKIAVMSDAGGVPGGTTAVNNINLTLDDSAASNLPDGGQMVAGTFKPTDIEPAAGEISEVTGAYDSSFAALIGDDPKDLNGTWTLYVKDDQANDAGFLNGGWAIEITEELASCCIPGLPTIENITDKTTNEDVPLVVNFTVNDNETPLANLTLTASSTNTALVDIGGIVFGGTGGARTATITPVLNQPLTAASATTKITITVKDGDQKTASDDFVVTVNQVNDFPTISDIGNVSTTPGTATADIPFTIGDVETAVGSLSVFTTSSNTTLVPNANVVLGGSGANRTVKVTPAANQFGSSTITVGVVDGSGATTSDTFVISVASPGDPTITNVADQSMNEGTTLSIPIVVNDAETPNKTNLVVTATSSNTTVVPNTTAGLFFNGGEAGAVTKPNNTTGAITVNIVPTGQLSSGQTATTTITLTVRDTDNRTATDTFVLTVNGVDNAPTITDITDRTTNEDVAVGAAFTVTDPDSSTITVTGTSSNTTLIPDANILFSGTGASRTIVVVPAANQFGTSTITVSATSGGAPVTDTFVVTVLSVNDLPTATGYPSGLVEVLEDPNNGGGTNFVFTIADVETAVANLVVTASSSDPNVVQNTPAALALSNVGAVYTLKVTPVTDKNGKTFISVNIADRGAADDNVSPGTTTLTFQLDVKSVSDGPTLTLSAASGTVNEDTVATVTATIADIESGPGAVVLSFESSNTTLLPVSRITETKVNDSTRTVNMLGATNASGGPVTVKIIATNPNTNLKRTNTFDLTITAVPDAPTISNIPDATIGKNQVLSAVAFTTTDPEGYGNPALTASIQSQTPGVGSPATLLLVNNILFGGSGDNRTLTVVPEANAHGTVVIRVTVNAADAATAFDDFTLTIQDRNSQPTITAIPNQNTVEDSITAPQVFTLGDLEDAANLNLLTVTAESTTNPDLIPLSNVFFGTTANPAERTVRVVPAVNKAGTATITVAVTDRGLPVGSNQASNRTSFTVTVAEIPDAPTLTDIANVSTNEDSIVVINFTVADAETAASNLTVTVTAAVPAIVQGGAGLVLGGSNGNRTLTITPTLEAPVDLGQTLTTAITVTVKDADNLTSSDTFNYSITAVNDSPNISDIPDQQIAEDSNTGLLLFLIGDPDVPSTLTTFAKSSNTTLVPETPAAISITTTNLTSPHPFKSYRVLKVTPAAGKSGVATITIGVYDQNNVTNTDTFVITVGSVNDLPTITNNNGNQVVPEDTVLNLPVVIGDDETGQAALKVTATSSNAAIVPNANITVTPADNANRTVTITPVANATGVTTITLRVEDADGGFRENVFTAEWTALNDTPTISAITDKTTAEDQPTAPIAITVGDVETAAADLVLSGGSSDTAKVPIQNIEFSGTGANRFVVVRPALDATGDVNITVTVTDGNGATASRTFKVTISAQTDAPTITAIADVTSAEDAPSPLITFTVADSDTAAGSLVVTATSSNTALVANNNIFIGANGGLRTMTILPTANQFGATIITVTVKDGNNLTASVQFTLTVTPVNDLPTISTIAAQNIPEDGATGELAFTVGDVETPVASLVLTKSSSNTTVVPTANVVLSGSGSARKVVVTAAPNKSGFSDVSITVIDANDGRATTTFRVTVAEDNDAPSISDLTNTTTPEGVAATVNFTVNDSETAPANLTIAASSSNTVLVPNANLVVSAGGTVRTLTVTPVAGLSGTSTITVTVTDGSNATASDSFVLTVTEVNRNDFNGDGLSDILFQNPDGTMAAFFMNGSDRIGTSFLNPNNPGDSRWKIAGTSDFNGDGKGDILFQHQDGTLSAWYMDGINFTGNALLNPSSAGDIGWRVVATADFDLDGKDDLLFQHSSGDLSIWYMNGINLRSSVLVNPSNAGDTRWLVVGATDVDKDSRADILFQHSDGTLAAWFMNGANRTGFDVLNPENPGPDWRVSANANFGQSTQSDLILQNINGDMQVWYMNGTHGELRKLLNPPNSGVDWFVVGPK